MSFHFVLEVLYGLNLSYSRAYVLVEKCIILNNMEAHLSLMRILTALLCSGMFGESIYNEVMVLGLGKIGMVSYCDY